MIQLGIPATAGSRTAQVVDLLSSDIEVQTLWYCSNRTSRRAAVNDHGPIHVRTAMQHGYRLLRLLSEAGVQPNCVTDHGMTDDDAMAVVLLAIAFHDTGMAIHRDRHELLSVPLALDWLRRKLPPIYSEPQLTVIISEVVHAVLAHSVNERTLTIEAGVVKVADALDMTKGRSRRAIESGKIDIHSISAASVETVRVTRGVTRPIRIEVDINNPAAVFHLKEVFGAKLARSSIEPYVEVPKLDELLHSLRELGTREDRQRNEQLVQSVDRTSGRDGAPVERDLGEPIGIGRGKVPTTIA
jgi:uncharacterized protein